MITHKTNTAFLIPVITCFVADVCFRFIMVFYNLPEYSWTMECNVITSFLRFENDISLYTDIYKAPFSIVQYGPIWYYFELLFYKITHLIELDSVFAAYYSGRIFSIFCILGCVWLCGLISKKVFNITFYNSIAIILIPYFLIITAHFFVARTDALAVFLSLGAIYVFFLKSNYSVVFATILFIIAAFTKQNQIFTLFGFFIYLIVEKNRKNLIQFLISGFVFTATICSILYYKFQYFFFQNLIDGLANGRSKGILNDKYIIIIAFFAGISLWALVIFANKINKDRSKIDLFFFSLLAVVNLFLNIVVSFKTGSDMNYFVDFLFIFSILLSGLYVAVEKKLKNLDLLKNITILILSVLICTNHWRYVSHDKFGYENEKAVSEYFYKVLKIEKKDLIIYDNSVHNILNNYIACNHFFPQLDVLGQINYAKNGIYVALIRKNLIENKNLFIVTTQDTTQYNVIGFIPVKCKLIKKINIYYIYKIIN